jgi:ElaB/YqjD/DUF883 family membrane-anchored ribosome-binding protein
MSERKTSKGKTMEASNRVETDKGEIRTKVENVFEKAKEVCERLQDQTTNAAKATDEALREHPYQAVGIAFGLGLLIGVLATRGRRD